MAKIIQFRINNDDSNESNTKKHDELSIEDRKADYQDDKLKTQDIEPIIEDSLEWEYDEPKYYHSESKCFKCQKEFGEYAFIWYINQQAGYGSTIDGDKVNIKICDECLQDFLKGCK